MPPVLLRMPGGNPLRLKGKNIVAAFEVECTTSIYSGLLRMSDLLALAPNMNIDLYVVAPEERRQKFQNEILRPTFSILERPLPQVCRFIAFNKMVEKLDGLSKLGIKLSGYRPSDFLDQLAESFKHEP